MHVSFYKKLLIYFLKYPYHFASLVLVALYLVWSVCLFAILISVRKRISKFV